MLLENRNLLEFFSQIHLKLLIVAMFIFIVGSGCATSQPYINKDVVNKIELVPSNYHQFSYIRAYYMDNQFVLYGKIKHTHQLCPKQEYVDLAIYNSNKKLLESANIQIVDRGTYRRGWFGAAFRIKINKQFPKDAVIRLAFHDSDCKDIPKVNGKTNVAVY